MRICEVFPKLFPNKELYLSFQIREVIAVLIMAGAICAFAREEEPFIPGNVPLTLEDTPLTPRQPLSAEDVNVPVPGNLPSNPGSFTEDALVKDGPFPSEVTGEESKDGSKVEGTDLKTDTTFWWPFYRSFYRYPYYRYYRPRYG